MCGVETKNDQENEMRATLLTDSGNWRRGRRNSRAHVAETQQVDLRHGSDLPLMALKREAGRAASDRSNCWSSSLIGCHQTLLHAHASKLSQPIAITIRVRLFLSIFVLTVLTSA